MVEPVAASPLPRGGLASASEGSSPSTSPRSTFSFFFSLMDKEVPSLISSASIAAGVSIARRSRKGKSSRASSHSASSSHSESPSPPLNGSTWTPMGPWSTALVVLSLSAVPRVFTTWQAASLGAALAIIFLARSLNLTLVLRRVLKPLVLKKVESGTRTVAAIQRHRHPIIDSFMCAMARTVSIEFYTAFLPIVFWSGRQDLGMMLACLLALCVYLGNGLKDVVCAPRPFCPPVVRVTGSRMEVHNSKEYGLPSTHTINAVSLSLYTLHWLQDRAGLDPQSAQYWVAALFTVTVLVVFGRLYLGMHSPIDLAAGLGMGLAITASWVALDDFVIHFLRNGTNVSAFSVAVCALALLAYPAPEHDTPSFEDHTSFSGVIMGLCLAFNVTLTPEGSSILPPELASLPAMLARVAVGLPVVLASKAAGKELGKLIWPSALGVLGVPLYSRKYIKDLTLASDSQADIKGAEEKKERSLDVDILVRLTQYGCLSWSVLGLVPFLFKLVGA